MRWIKPEQERLNQPRHAPSIALLQNQKHPLDSLLGLDFLLRLPRLEMPEALHHLQRALALDARIPQAEGFRDVLAQNGLL